MWRRVGPRAGRGVLDCSLGLRTCERFLKEVFGVGAMRAAVAEAGVLGTAEGEVPLGAGVLCWSSSVEDLRRDLCPGVLVGVMTLARL